MSLTAGLKVGLKVDGANIFYKITTTPDMNIVIININLRTLEYQIAIKNDLLVIFICVGN